MGVVGASSPDAGVWTDAQKLVYVGSAPGNDLVVTAQGVSKRHCMVCFTRDRKVMVKDLGSTNGTFINGTRLVHATELTVSDRMTLGPEVEISWSVLQSKLFDPTQAMHQLKTVTVGSGADNDVVLNYPMISRHHARLYSSGDRWLVEDLNSTNGTALNHRDNRITQAEVGLEDVLYLAVYRLPVRQLVLPTQRFDQAPPTAVAFVQERLIVGRAPDADVVIDHPSVSLHHVELRKTVNGIEATDLGSTNGTFINGVRVQGTCLLKPEDELALGSYVVALDTEGVQRRDMRGHFTLAADAITLTVPAPGGAKTLLDQVSFCIYPGEFCGLMGTSGAGKTTLLRTALGYYKPTTGGVWVNGRNLHREYDRFRTSLGYVPQEDILHGDLTVEQALTYSARLRLGPDLSKAELDALIDKVLGELGLFSANAEIRTTRISQTSGGQRRRLNMAIELLVDPSIFFLDEPTSGLSSQDALEVMTMLRGLADQGKIILLTLHQPSLEGYRLMDHIMFLHKGGRTAFFGPAYPDSLAYTNPELPAEALTTPDLALSALSQKAPEEWQARYRQSPEHARYVTERLQGCTFEEGGGPAGKRPMGSFLHQWRTLTARNLRIKLQDTMNSAVLLIQAPVIAALIALTFGQDGDAAFNPQYASVALFLLVVSSIWFGCSNAARDICGEWDIYQRERMYNLNLPAFVGAKLTIGALICAVQCLVLTAIVVPTCRLSTPFPVLYGMVWATALTGTSLGLLVSAFASPFRKRTEIAIGTIPLLLIPIVVLGGVIKPLKDMGDGAAAVASTMISRWSFEGLLHLEASRHEQLKDAMIAAFLDVDKTYTAAGCLGVLGLFFLTFTATTLFLLKRRDII